MNFDTLVLKQKNIQDFALARNKMLKSKSRGWVLFLDTDETLSKELKKELENLGPEDFNGFYIKRKIIFLGRAIGKDKVLRLGKRNAGKWTRKVHEVWEVKGKIGTLKNYIIHNTATDIYSYVEKMNKYSDLHAVENFREGKRSNVFKILIFPKLKFIQNLLLGRGILFSFLMSLHSFLGWAKLWEYQMKKHG